MRKILAFFLASALLLCCGLPALAEEPAVDGAVVIPASDASYTKDKGVFIENKKLSTTYDEEHGMIVNLAKGTEITFTVPEGVDGRYDVYLSISKILVQFSSQPFSFSINGEEPWSVPLDCQVSADSPAKDDADGAEYNTGSIYDVGRFLIKSDKALKSGDTVTVIASYGAKGPMLKGITYPGVAGLTLAPVGAEVGVGYDYTVPEKQEVDSSDPLSGKTILWLGSSVTYGAHAGGHYSMVDAVRDLHPALVCEKYAVSATTLVNGSDDSYVSRLYRIPTDKQPDLIVVQLSTNDATTGKPFGEIAEGRELSDFDDSTIAGAIETIIVYARDTFDCPVCFYSGSYCMKENYAEMVELLLKIQEKWGIGVIDLFNNAELNEIYGSELYDSYMFDEVHPTRSGYVEWWTPVIDAALCEYMSAQ